jgi:hypothetical protein
MEMTMTERKVYHGIGVYMRDAAMLLTNDPVDYRTMYDLLEGRRGNMDRGYVSAALIRLAERGIAKETESHEFVRGPMWIEAAKYYKWEADYD